MNRTVVIGGVVAVAVLLGVAAWFLMTGGPSRTPTGEVAGEPEGPIALNPVAVVTDHSASESEDGRTLNITFPSFELAAKAGETTSAVFSTTWRLKLGPDERAVVAAATLDGYMKSAGAPAPAIQPAPAPAQPTTAEATTDATPAAEGEGETASAAPTETPAKPTVPVPVRPVAGGGVARIIVSFGNETSVVEWRDTTGEGAARRIAKALAFTGGPDTRSGGKVPVTVTVEVSGGNATETLARLNELDLRLFAEDAPLPKPEPAATETPAEGAAKSTEGAETPTEPGGETTPADGTETTPAEQPESPSP